MSALGFPGTGSDVQKSWGYVGHECADGHCSSTDMTTALHLRTLVVLTRRRHFSRAEFGSLVKIQTSAKPDLRNPEFVTPLFVTGRQPSGFPGKHGHSWLGGV